MLFSLPQINLKDLAEFENYMNKLNLSNLIYNQLGWISPIINFYSISLYTKSGIKPIKSRDMC